MKNKKNSGSEHEEIKLSNINKLRDELAAEEAKYAEIPAELAESNRTFKERVEKNEDLDKSLENESNKILVLGDRDSIQEQKKHSSEELTVLASLHQNKRASIAALIDVYNNYLIKPYADLSGVWRGSYIDKHGTLRQDYPKGLLTEEGGIYRPNHGLAHNVRVVSKVSAVVKLYVGGAYSKLFSEFTEEKIITQLEIVAAFLVACRDSEAGWNPEPDSPYQRYRRASSEAFYAYAKELGRETNQSLFTDEELDLYKAVLVDPYFDSKKDKILLQDEKSNLSSRKQAAIKAILSACHALDLARCFGAKKMNEKIHEVSVPLGDLPYPEKIMAVAPLFIQSEIQHLLTGDNHACSFDGKVFVPSFLDRKSALFKLSSTDPEMCVGLVSLSQYIHSTKDANSLAEELNEQAKKGRNEFKQLLLKLEKNKSSDPKLSNEHDSKPETALFLNKYNPEELAVLAKIPRLYRNKRAYRYSQDIININPEKVSKINMIHLSEQLMTGAGLSAEEKLKKGDKLLTQEEKRLYAEILKTPWTLKHITFDYNVIKEKGNILKSLQQRIREDSSLDNKRTPQGTGKDDNVFFTLGSPQHKGAAFLQDKGGYIISLDVNRLAEEGKLKETLSGLQLSDHTAQYIAEGSFSQTYGDTRRQIKFFNETDESFALTGHKVYSYHRQDGTVLTRTLLLGQEVVIGEDVFPFIAYNLILELRYIGGQYRQHIFNHLGQSKIIEAAIDNFYHSSNFEVTIPSQINLDNFYIRVEPQDTNSANTVENALLMHAAVSKRKIDEIKSLLAAGVSIDILDAKGATPLINSLLSWDTAEHNYQFNHIPDFLIDKGANLELIYQGRSPLSVAIERGKRDIVEKMLAKKIVDVRDNTIFRQIDINRDSLAIILGINGGYLHYFLAAGLDVEKYSPYIMSELSKKIVSEEFVINSINLLFQRAARFNYGKSKERDHFFSLTLLNAIHQQKLDLTEKLIEWGCDINATHLSNEHQWADRTPLMLAVSSGNIEMVKMLLQAGVDISKCDKDGRNVLAIAAAMQDQKLLSLLQHQFNLHKMDASRAYKKAISKALIYGKSRKSDELYFLVGQKRNKKYYELFGLDNNKTTYQAKNAEELTITAVHSGALIDLKRSITCGDAKHVKKESYERYDSLENDKGLIIETHHYVVQNINKVKPYAGEEYSDARWIRASDILNRPDWLSPYDYPSIEALIKNQPNDHTRLDRLFELNTQLFTAIQKNDAVELATLLAAGADVNSLNDKNLTPLAIACDTPQPNLALIQTLTQAGALLNHACVYGERELVALQLAMLQQSKLLVNLLCENGADPNQKIKSNNGLTQSVTPLLTACELEDIELIETLVNYGADFKIAENKVALAYLCTKQCTDDLFDYLLAHVGINEAMSGYTPLMLCAMAGNTDRIKKLLAKGVDTSIRHPKSLKTAGDFAREKRHTDALVILADSEVTVSQRIGALDNIETYYTITDQTDSVSREALFREEFCLVHLEREEFSDTKSFLYQLAAEVTPENFDLSYEITVTAHSDHLIQTLPVFNKPVIAIHKDFLTGIYQKNYSIDELVFSLAGELIYIKNHAKNLFIYPGAAEQYDVDQMALEKCQNAAAALAYLRHSAAYQSEDSENFKLPNRVFVYDIFSSRIKASYGDRIKRLETYLAENPQLSRVGRKARWIDSDLLLNELNLITDKNFFVDQFPSSLSKVEQINYLTSCLQELKIEVMPYELTQQPSRRVKEFCLLIKNIGVDLTNEQEYQAVNEFIQQAFDLRISAFTRIYDAVCNTTASSELIPLGPFKCLAEVVKRFIAAKELAVAKNYAAEVQEIFAKLSSHFDSYLDTDNIVKIAEKGRRHLELYLSAQDSQNKHLPTQQDRYFGSNIGGQIVWPSFQKQNDTELPWNEHIKFLDAANEGEAELIVKTLEMLGVTHDVTIWEKLSDKLLLTLVSDKHIYESKKITRLPTTLAQYTMDKHSYDKKQKKLYKILINRNSSPLQADIFNQISDFEKAFKEFYDNNIGHLRISRLNKIRNANSEAVHLLLDRFSTIAQSGTEEEKRVVKSFFLNRSDHRDLAHLLNWNNEFYSATLKYSDPYIKFVMEQTYQNKEFQLFSLGDIVKFYSSKDVNFYIFEMSTQTWLKIIKSELLSSDLSIDTVITAMSLLNNLLLSREAEKIFKQYIDTCKSLSILSQEAVVLVRLLLIYCNSLISSASLKADLLDKLNWDQLSENINCRLSAEDVLILYRIHDGGLKFPSIEKQKFLERLLLSKIKNTFYLTDKIGLLEQLMFTGGDFSSPLRDISFRNEIITLWTEATLKKYGQDNASYAYYLTMKNVIDHIKGAVSAHDKRRLFQQLANALETQSWLSVYMGQIISPQETKSALQVKEIAVTILGGVLKALSKKEVDKIAVLDFLSSPLSEGSLDAAAEHMLIHHPDHCRDAFSLLIRELCGLKGGDRPYDKYNVKKVLMMTYDMFWDLSLEERAGAMSYLLISTDEVLSLQDKKAAYDKALDYVMHKLFPNAQSDAQENFSAAFLAAYLETADEYKCNYLLAGMIVTSNEANSDGTAPSPGHKLALLCEHLGPAYIKLAQAIHSHPRTPENIRHDLDHIKGRANPPYRWDLWRLINKVLPPHERENIERIGRLLGSASYNLAMECKLKNYAESVVLLLLRDNAAKEANEGFTHLYKAVNACGHDILQSNRETALDMLAEAEKMSTIEMDKNCGDKQHQLAATLYHGLKVPVRVENTSYQIEFVATKTLSSGLGYRFLDRIWGTEFNDLPRTTNQDKTVRKAVAKAIIKTELKHILNGSFFDCDRHGNQLRVQVNSNNRILLGLFDFGEMSLENPSFVELRQFAQVLHNLPCAFHQEMPLDELLNGVIKAAKAANQASTYLMRVRKAFLALQDFQKELTNLELLEILKATNMDDVHPLFKVELNNVLRKMGFFSYWFDKIKYLLWKTPINFNLSNSIDRQPNELYSSEETSLNISYSEQAPASHDSSYSQLPSESQSKPKFHKRMIPSKFFRQPSPNSTLILEHTNNQTHGRSNDSVALDHPIIHHVIREIGG